MKKTRTRAYGLKHAVKLTWRAAHCSLVLLIFGTVTFAQSPKIEITDPKVPAGTVFLTQGTVDLTVSVTGMDVKRLRALVSRINEAKEILDSTKQEFDVDITKREQSITVNVFKGQNIIRLIALKGPDLDPDSDLNAVITVTCSGKKCGAISPAGSTGTGDRGSSGEQTPGSKHIDINMVTSAESLDAAVIEPVIIVQSKSGISKLSMDVYNNGTLIDHKDDIPIESVSGREFGLAKPKLKIAIGKNELHVYDPLHLKENAYEDVLVINCKGDNCKKAAIAAASGDASKPVRKITINRPSPKEGEPYRVDDIQSVDSWVTVDPSIKKIQYDVTSPRRKDPWTGPVFNVVGDEKEIRVPLKFLHGLNTIRIYDADHPSGENGAAIIIECKGDKCATDFDFATINTNSQNTRVLVGLEQAGGSSTESKTKPFVDFFFNAPFLFGKKDYETVLLVDFDGNPILDKDRKRQYFRPPTNLARLNFWGQVRVTSTPEQLTATGVFPSTLANQVAQSGTTGNLVQSFDFLAGLDVRLFTASGTFLSLIPNISQKTVFSLAAAYGAISPLDATKENTRFFLIPDANSPQRTAFEERFGAPKAKVVNGTAITPTHVAFVPLERDKFFKQWYAGIRLKTFYCDGEDKGCYSFRNTFPAILDVMVGQNELVTGGSLKRTTDEGKIKQAFVLKFDAFYPLPFRETRFIYLYGTAILKLGGDVRVQVPLLLEPATSVPGINDPLIYIPPIEFLQRQQPNRDYYKIGVGINLTDFFNRNSPR